MSPKILDILVKCQAGEMTCIRALELIEQHTDTPNPELPPLNPDGPRRKMLIEIEVNADFEKSLNNQWEVEREIHADRWAWHWKDNS